MKPMTPEQLLELRRVCKTRGAILGTLRTLAGETGAVAAVGMGLSWDTLCRLEHDKAHPTEKTLLQVAAHYGVKIGDLYPA